MLWCTCLPSDTDPIHNRVWTPPTCVLRVCATSACAGDESGTTSYYSKPRPSLRILELERPPARRAPLRKHSTMACCGGGSDSDSDSGMDDEAWQASRLPATYTLQVCTCTSETETDVIIKLEEGEGSPQETNAQGLLHVALCRAFRRGPSRPWPLAHLTSSIPYHAIPWHLLP